MRKIIIICSFLSILLIPPRCNMARGTGNIIIHPSIDKKEEEIIPDVVTLTTYSTTIGETDSTPLITASGYKIKEKNPKRQRIIAVSRDLKKKYRFGQKVRITHAGRYNGIYTVRDLMNKRWRKKIDILVNPNDKDIKIRKVKMYMVKK